MTSITKQKNIKDPSPLKGEGFRVRSRGESLMARAAGVLVEKLGISEASEFWNSLGYGQGDYLKIKRKLFDKESTGSLFKKIKKFQNS